MRDQAVIDALIEASSLGTPKARRLRAAADPRLVAIILGKPWGETPNAHYREVEVAPGDLEGEELHDHAHHEEEHLMADRHVVPNPEGGWDIKSPGGQRRSGHADTQAAAISRAKEIVGNAGGGEVRIHGRDGRIRDSDTVAPGNDPFPPRDTR